MWSYGWQPRPPLVPLTNDNEPLLLIVDTTPASLLSDAPVPDVVKFSGPI